MGDRVHRQRAFIESEVGSTLLTGGYLAFCVYTWFAAPITRAEMDGVSSDNQELLIMAGTNAPWHVDPALRRPGRFDRVLFIPPPDEAARLEILRLHLRNRSVGKDVDAGQLPRQTAEYSGGDLAELVERATDAPLQEAMRGGESRPLTQTDLMAALKKMKPTTRMVRDRQELCDVHEHRRPLRRPAGVHERKLWPGRWR